MRLPKDAPAALLVPVTACLVDLVYGGPLGAFPTLRLRYLLFGAASVALLLTVAARGLVASAAIGPALLSLFLLAWSLPWATLIPAKNGIPLKQTFAEADALLMLVTIALATLALSTMFERVRAIVVRLALLLATAQVGLWLVGLLAPTTAQRIAPIVQAMYGDNGVYVQPMPDGAYRVFWISSLWCLLGAFWAPLVFARASSRLASTTLLVGSIVASYSRGMWIGAAAGALASTIVLFRRDPRRLVAVCGVLTLGMILVGTQVDFVRARVVSIASDTDISLQQRREQLTPLIAEWKRAPIVGVGFGAVASVTRSKEEPFSYEMVPVSLLMKMGLVGVTGVAVFWILVVARGIALATRVPAESASFVGATVALLAVWSTNPLFLNFVGMGVLGCLMLQLASLEQQARAKTPYHSPHASSPLESEWGIPHVSRLIVQAPRQTTCAPTLSISVVSYRPDPTHFEAMLASLGRALDDANAGGHLIEATVTLVDNGPGHDWRAMLADRLARLAAGRPWLAAEVVAPPVNVGYGRGHNLAIARSSAHYHLVLNPDVTLDQRAIAAAIVFMEGHPETGLLAPFVAGLSGHPEYLCKRYPSVFDLWLRGFAPARLRRAMWRRLAWYEMRDVIGDTEVDSVPMVSGCFMFARQALLRQVRGFSPRYFMYFEDYDLSLRLGRHARLSYVPAVRVVHAGGRAARKGFRHIRMFVVSAARFFQTYGWKWW